MRASETERPRLGVLFVTSGWFRDVGLQGEESSITTTVDLAAARIIEKIKEFGDPVFSGVLFSASEAEKAAKEIHAADVDGIILSPLMWCEDVVVRSALKLLKGLPLILWSFSPQATLPSFVPFQTMLQGSGAVCTLQISGMLKREGVEYWPVAGHIDDPAVYEEIRVLSVGMAIRRRLHTLRIGVLPFPCDQMSTTFVDEFGLRTQLGIELKYLELERVRKIASKCEDSEIVAFKDELLGSGVQVSVDERNLMEGIRYALSIEKLMAEEGIKALAMNEIIPEMHESFGLRPCLWNKRLSASGAVISMEADIGAVTAMFVLRQAIGESPFYTEPQCADWERGHMILGHAGYHDASNADPSSTTKVISDVEYENSDRFTGATAYFKYRPGPVTLVNSVWSGRDLKWLCFEGESIAGPLKLQGISHLLLKPDIPLKSFFTHAAEEGVSQHWVVVPGRIMTQLQAMCSVIGIRFSAV